MAKRKRSAIVKELDKWFSLYIRLRNSDYRGYSTCVTCGKVDHYKKLQAGHFASRKHYATRWHEDNVQVQCYGCNVMQQGQQYLFAKWLGTDLADNLINESHKSVKFSDQDLLEKIAYYKEIVKNHENYSN
jgi:5-methylcytosine-specific restriction endonuclease McrA